MTSPDPTPDPGPSHGLPWRSALLPALLAILLAPSWAAAQTPTPLGAEFGVSLSSSFDFRPEVAMRPNGEFVVVWRTYAYQGEPHLLLGRRFDSTGQPLGGELSLAPASLFQATLHQVEMDADSGFSVVWAGYEPAPRLVGQHFNDDGSPRSGLFDVSTGPTAGGPQLSSDGHGNLVAVWDPGLPAGVMGRLVDSGGTPTGSEFQVNTSPVFDGWHPRFDVARDADGRFLVVWDDLAPALTDLVHGRFFHGDGQPAGDDFQIAAATTWSAFATAPSVHADPAGGFVVLWTGGDDYPSQSIHGRRFDTAGSPVATEFVLDTLPSANYPWPAPGRVAVREGGDMVRVWQGCSLPGGCIIAQALDRTGNRIGSGFAVDPVSAPYVDRPGSIAMSPSGQFVVAWLDGSGYEQYEIRGRLFEMAPPPPPPPNEPPVASAGMDLTPACTSAAGAVVSLDGSGSSDPDSTPGTHDDITLFEWFLDYGMPAESLIGTGEQISHGFPLGTSMVTLRVTDTAGASDTDEVEVHVVDPDPPALSLAVAPEILWPPNHRLVPVEVTASATDDCGTPTVILEAVLSSDPDDAPGAGDGHTTGDIRNADLGTADFSVDLRAERVPAGPGRIYTLVYVATDPAGMRTTATVTVGIPTGRSGSSRMRHGETRIGRSGESARDRNDHDRHMPERPPE